MSGRVYVDTSAYYALADPTATEHAKARVAFERLTDEGTEFYTSNFVIAETHALILNRVNGELAERVIDRLYASRTRINQATEGDQTRARAILHLQRDKTYSLTDAISFAIMRRLHLRYAWTYDRHFTQFGFTSVQ